MEQLLLPFFAAELAAQQAERERQVASAKADSAAHNARQDAIANAEQARARDDAARHWGTQVGTA